MANGCAAPKKRASNKRQQQKAAALVTHASAEVVAQRAIPTDGSEQQTVAQLLRESDLTQRVVIKGLSHCLWQWNQ